MNDESYDDIFDILKDLTNISRDEFERMIDEILQKHENLISRRGAAIIIARKYGINTSEIIYPPIIGRLIEVGPVRTAKSPSGQTPFVLFALVNEEKRIQGVAFGEHHVNLLRSNEDKPLRIRGYSKARLERYSGIKITERSTIEVLDDNVLPPIEKLSSAWAPSLKFIKENRGAWLVKCIALDQFSTEYPACPICGKAIDMIEENWVCPEHGSIDTPKYEKIWRFVLSDKSGVFPAVYFKELPRESLVNRMIVVKGYFKDEEFYIMKFYSVSEHEVITA